MKVSFLVSSQSILKRLSQNFATFIYYLVIWQQPKFRDIPFRGLVFQKLDHLTCNGILRINQNEINEFIHVIEERHK